MLRDVEIEDIWDGRFYGPDDRVKVGCNDCAGCSDCCRNTGDTIVIDPFDMYMLEKATGKTFSDMIEHEIEIRLVDGVILPNIMESGGQDAAEAGAETEVSAGCRFLDGEGRCSIHRYRPGFCRLFPVGRFYVDGEKSTARYRAGEGAFEKGKSDRYFCYFVQRKECTKRDSPRYKVKLRDWIGIKDLEKYEDFIVRWHFFVKDVGAKLNMMQNSAREPIARYLLQMFYVEPYNTELDFYAQFEMRLARVRIILAPLGALQ